mmetsp:Transcript_64435/g.151009  ORF Transcript_64435/g.151009 Transcript_64435/m.151009 type:complete len:81 (-) Transcript_64435:14-256(-)
MSCKSDRSDSGRQRNSEISPPAFVAKIRSESDVQVFDEQILVNPSKPCRLKFAIGTVDNSNLILCGTSPRRLPRASRLQS